MRNNPEIFDRENDAAQRELRLVIEIGYGLPLYISSHNDIPNLPVNAIQGALKKCSATSQRLMPEQGRAEIGAISFEVVDLAGDLSYVLRDELQAGNGIKGQQVRLWLGFRGLDWADYRLEQTQIAEESVGYKEGVYRVRCRDVQREMRKDIFEPRVTRLAANFLEAAGTLQVFDTSKFEPFPHTSSFGDAPGQSVYYLKIKYQDGYEIVRATGKTATSFTGVDRGLFGTLARDHVIPTENDDEKGIEVEEFIYIELPGPAMAYALLTGNIPNTANTLPSNWHLGIDPGLVVLDEFEQVGADWYRPGDYSKGKILRFDGLKKTDGKKFIETEINLLLGAYMPVNAAGQLGFRRMNGVLADAGTMGAITADDVTSLGELKYDLAGVRNVFAIQWSWFERPGFDGQFLRANSLIDADSITSHGAAKPHTLKFRGLHNSRHTYTTIKTTFDALRDRFAGPPLHLRLGLLPSNNSIEVGDVLRVSLPQVRDHSNLAAGETLDRAMEVQRISVDQTGGAVSVDLFGSYQSAGNIPDQPAGTSSTAELPDGWYDDDGQSMTAAGLSIDGSGFLTADGGLAGAGGSRAVYYHLGDLTIPAGRTLTISDNVELRVRGVLQIDGEIVGTPGYTGRGFLGTARGGAGSITGKAWGSGMMSTGGAVIQGRNEVMPAVAVVNDGGDLLGIPDDMRGSGGASGGSSWFRDPTTWEWERTGTGGAGGDGGASLSVVARGVAFGASGKINTSGGDGSVGTALEGETVPGGTGGGGAPGGVLLVVDGTQNPLPVLTNSRIEACYGSSPDPGGPIFWPGPGYGDHCLGTAAARVMFVPKSREPYPDHEDPAVDPKLQEALNAAADAQADATAALTELDNIGADGKLHASEKLRVIREFAQLEDQRTGLVATANDYGLTAERNQYTGALDALGSYLGGLSPAWNDTNTTTPISRTVWNANWQLVYLYRQDLLNAFADVATWASIGGIGRPEDYATATGQTQNLVYDQDFELSAVAGTSDYMHGNSGYYSALPTGGENGGAALRIDPPDTNPQTTVNLRPVPNGDFIPAKAGQTYYLRARVYLSPDFTWVGGSDFRAQITVYDTSESWIETQVFFGMGPLSLDQWMTVAGRVTLTDPTIAKARLRLVVNDSVTAGYALVDFIEISTSPITYFGDMDATYGATTAQAQQITDAEAAAAAAQVDATEALTDLIDVAADNKLHPAEKKESVARYDVLTGERVGIEAQAEVFGITTEKTDYGDKLDALTTYLAGLSPAWNNYNSSTTIARSTWETRWKDAYTTKQTLLNKIADEASKRARWSQIANDDGELTVVRAGIGAGFFNGCSGQHVNLWTERNGTLAEDGDAYSGSGAVLITSTVASGSDSAAGATSGSSLTIPEDIALQFGGRRVRVSFYAKQPASNAASEFAVAYSTADVGNSGWLYFAPTATWTRYDLVWDVPNPGSGGIDYIGIWGDTSGGGAGVLIDSVLVEIIPKESDLDALNLGNAASIRNDNISETDIKSATGWADVPESGATHNTGALADANSVALTDDNRVTGQLPGYKAAQLLRNDRISLSSDGFLTYDDGSPVNIGAVTRGGLGAISQGEADNRIGDLRPDSQYKNSNLSANDVQEQFVLQYVGGRGANLNHPAYTRFLGYTLPPFQWEARVTTSLTGVANSPIGDSALSIECTSTSNHGVVTLRPESDKPIFQVEQGKKYIFSCWANASTSGVSVNLRGWGNDGTPITSGGSSETLNQGWRRVSWVRTAGDSGGCHVRVHIINTTWDVGDWVRIDGVMVEEAVGDQTDPSALQQTGASYIDPYTGQPFDQRGLPMVQSDVASSNTSQVCTAVDAGSTATINIAAHTVQYGGFTVNYNAASITGLDFSQRYHVYCDDAGYAGGAITYFATTNWADAKAGVHRRHVDSITTPSDGGGGTTGLPDCVASGMWLLEGLRVDDAMAGDSIDVWDIGDDDAHQGAIEAIRPAPGVPCVRITMESGARVECSVSTPVTGPDGEVRHAPDALGMRLGVLHGQARLAWERVTAVEPIGRRTVYHLGCGNISFAAGTDPHARIITHNIQWKPGP